MYDGGLPKTATIQLAITFMIIIAAGMLMLLFYIY
jgi:hypothetical protein